MAIDANSDVSLLRGRDHEEGGPEPDASHTYEKAREVRTEQGVRLVGRPAPVIYAHVRLSGELPAALVEDSDPGSGEHPSTHDADGHRGPGRCVPVDLRAREFFPPSGWWQSGRDARGLRRRGRKRQDRLLPLPKP